MAKMKQINVSGRNVPFESMGIVDDGKRVEGER
jgi:hypothetical protein